MTISNSKHRWLKIGRYCVWLSLAWVVFVALPSLKIVRAVLIQPLYVHHEEASGEVAYVMADGYAYLERLRAASDLYHMGRVKEIYLLNERRSSGYDFVSRKLLSNAERAIGYLEHLGVERQAVRLIDAEESSLMSSLSEAEAMAEVAPRFKSVVVVTSAPHTRRSLLCFQWSFPSETKITVFSATRAIESAELYAPISHEYFKLLVYYLFA